MMSVRLLVALIVVSLLLVGCAQEQPAAPSVQASEQPVVLPSTEPASTPELPSVEVEQPKLLNFNKPDLPIVIKYYSNWDVAENPADDVLVSFTSPKETALDAMRESLMVMVSNFSSSPVTLDEYTLMLNEELNETIDDAELLESKKTTIAGEQGWKLVYSGTVGNLRIKFMLVYTIQDDVLYDLTYNAEESKYAEYLPIAKEMIDSFEIR
ncbi:MAG: hypothetical protein V1834_04945 [Candidatus Micrarchaeota archaeon]